MKYILCATDPISAFEKRGGGKAMNLAKMSQRDIPVPPWFCLTVEAFDLFVEVNDLAARLEPEPHLGSLDVFAKEVEALFLEHALPGDVQREIDAQLAAMDLTDRFLAVRSSGIDEDAAGHSFAGQFSSFLNQKGADSLSRSIRRSWASGFSERDLRYRMETELGLSDIRVGVVLQLMAEAAVAGVAFSRNPIHPLDRDHLVVESVFGLGEGLVSGELDADHFEVNRSTLVIDRSNIALKEIAIRCGEEGGLVREAVEADLQTQPSVSEAQISNIAQMALRLEEYLGAPQDIEWVIDGDGSLYLVQTRPITTLPNYAFFDETVNGGEPILWDNSNIIESYSGVTLPLTFSFASKAYYEVYIQFCRVMGVPKSTIKAHDSMFRNMLGLIRGHVYYNLINWYRLIEMLPLAGRSGSFMETMMGVKQELKPEVALLFDFMQRPSHYSWPRRIWVASATLWRFVRLDAIVNGFLSRFERIYQGARGADFNGMSLPALVQQYKQLEDQVLRDWQAPIINDYMCMIFFGLLKRLTETWVGPSEESASLQNDLLCGQGGLESTEPTKMLMRIARWIDEQGQDLRRWVEDTLPEEMWRQMLVDQRWPQLKERIDEYLKLYGFRCVDELKLEAKDLHEDPTFIIEAIASYTRSNTYDIRSMDEREAAIRRAAEAIVNQRLGVIKKEIFYWVLKHARKAVRNRENLRFARTKIFGIARHLFLAVGAQLERLEIIESDRDIFYLTVDEVVSFVEGRPTSLNLRSTIAIRRREFDEYRNTSPPPDRFLTYGAAGVSIGLPLVLADADLLRAGTAKLDNPNILMGTPCCPGIVEGVVRVAHSSKDAEGINGEILVTERTDPGWVPVYPSCAGLLIERGSLLSHSAVVARELGLPTIVGISGGLMKRLQSGQRVRIDAGRGEVRILS